MSITSYFLPLFSRKTLLALASQLAIACFILISFQLSHLFELEKERVHILSFTVSFMTAMFLRYQSAALPAVILSLLTHYLFISQRDPAVALAFSTILPLVVFLFTQIFLGSIKSLEKSDLTLKAVYYLCTMVVIYPIVMTVTIVIISTAFNYPFMDDLHFYGYAILSSALNQALLTPLCLSVLIWFTEKPSRKMLLSLDKQMKHRGESQNLYRLWFTVSSIILLSAFMADDLLTLYALCIILVPIIGLGLGRFGYIQSCLLTFGLTLISTYSSVNAFDAEQITLETFYSLIAMLFTITCVIFLMVAQAIKNHLTIKAVIQKERKDPYTGLYTLSQLKDDAQHLAQPTLIMVDLEETTKRLKTLGLSGRKELVTQLASYLSHHPLCTTAYVTPFTTGLIYLSDKRNVHASQLQSIYEQSIKFDFVWHQRSIKVLNPKVKYGHILPNQNIGDAVSVLCSPEQAIASFEATKEIDLSFNNQQDITKLSKIQTAFDDNIFQLYCQPYRNLQSEQQALSFEILLRLPQGDGEVLPPAEFFPLIHEFGLEVELDKWVIKNTFKLLSQNVTSWKSIETCCINLTAQALTHVGLSDEIADKAKRYRIPLEKICFEITESMPLDNEIQASLNITALQEKGCKIALDDFGTGYASFDYLRRIPVDILKIDGSFVRQIHLDDTDHAIVSNISQIAQNMGLKTVAEFVESERHATILADLNVNYAQGFGIAKPRPLVEELTKHNMRSV